jgi:hypothetical protein
MCYDGVMIVLKGIEEDNSDIDRNCARRVGIDHIH